MKKTITFFKTLLLAVIMLVVGNGPAWGQSIWTNPITGTNPNTSNPYTTGDTKDANITVSGIGRGSGITGTNANDRYNANGWSTNSTLDANDYFYFTITPSSGYKLNLVSLVYTGQASNNGATTVAIRSSLDSYTTNIGTATVAGTTINLSNSSYQNLTSPITLRIYGWGAAGGTFSINSFTFNGTVSPTGNTSPSLSTPTSASITNTTATLGASITYNGGEDPTASGVLYGTSAAPTGNATATSPNVASGAFIVPVSSLLPETQYYYRGYATNSYGTGYSSDGTFRTLSSAPTAQATALTGTATSNTALNISWAAATFPSSGATTKGYVLLRATSPNIPSLSNGNGAAPAAGANTTIVSSTIAEAATSQASSSLSINQTYNYLLVPYCWDGSNATTYNYLTASAPTVSLSTPSNLSDVVAVASSESATISSLVNDAAPLTAAAGAQAWQITVRDGGSAMNDADILPTIVTGFTLTQSTGNAMDNWLDAIKTIALFDGSTWIANASSITATTIVFSGLNISVNDNASKTLTLRLSLNPTLNNVGIGNVDGDDFVFSITNTNFIVATDGSSSAKSSFSTISSTNGQNVVSVEATKLEFSQQPSNVVTNTNMSPSVTVRAIDAGGNIDRGYVSSISITANGATLTGSPNEATAALGVATFSSLQFSDVASGVTLTASSSGLTDATSITFNTTLGMGSYIYQTRQTGNWNGVTSGSETWERSSDGGVNWLTVTSSGDLPNSSAGTITVKAGHIVTVSASTNADQLTVEATGQITIAASQTFTIADGTGTDAMVNGILKNTGTLTNNGQMTFGNGGKYEHNKNGGTIPTATWDSNSTIEVTGVTSSIPTFSSSVTYANVTWNCPNQYSSLNFLGALKNIAGNLRIVNTGSSSELRLLATTSNYTISVGGDLIVEGGKLVFSNGNAITSTLSLGGNYNQTGGEFNGDASNSMNFEFTGIGKIFSNSGTITNTDINWSIKSGASLTLNNDLPVASSRSLTVNGILDCGTNLILGSLQINTGGVVNVPAAKQLTISGAATNNGTITIQSNASGTGTIVGNVSGAATVQQYLPGDGRQWWYLSSPVTGAKSTLFGSDKVGKYNEATTSYTSPFSTETNLVAGTGYVVKRAVTTPGTYTFEGTLNNGDYTLLPTRTGVTAGKRGFNLVGNPYPSYLDWDVAYADAATSNVSNAIWYRTYSGGQMTFHTYADADGVPEITTGIIPPAQAFWIRVNADGSNGTITFKNAHREHAGVTANPLKAPKANDRPRVRLQISNGVNADEALIVAKSYASNGIDSYDIEKMSNDNVDVPEIYTLLNNQDMVINSFNSFVAGQEIALGMRPGKAGDFTISATQLQNIPSEMKVILKDKFTGTETELSENASYSFNADGVVTNQRFSLLFRAPGSVTGIDNAGNQTLFVYAQQSEIVVNGEELKGSKITVYTATGQSVMQVVAAGNREVLNGNFAPGVYFVKVNNTVKKVSVK